MQVNGSIFVGVPVLNRADLLARCLGHLDLPATIAIINNNRMSRAFNDEVEVIARRHNALVLPQRRNLGVAASWNLIVRTGLNLGFHWFFIASNDTFLRPGSLAAACATAIEPDVAVWHLHAFNFFLLNRQTIERVGWFDENFYPAYKEDQDYSYRCRLAGMRRINVPGAGADHLGSATINSNPSYKALNAGTHHDWNTNHYRLKWGGDAGEEKFTQPYNDSSRDHRWWPDPGESIDHRDWDRAATLH